VVHGCRALPAIMITPRMIREHSHRSRRTAICHADTAHAVWLTWLISGALARFPGLIAKQRINAAERVIVPVADYSNLIANSFDPRGAGRA
jgi:hypothetical protein